MRAEKRTIVAVSTPAGHGGIAVIRMSGPEAIGILSHVWKGAEPADFKSHTAHLGWICYPDGTELDQVVATLFRAPNSYTGEDVIEISCHGSRWLQGEIVSMLIDSGAAAAKAGEFTERAFLNGRIDLAQADGIADMIAASSKAAARLAATQLKGAFSKRLEKLRKQLVDLGVLLELELDFSEEDVEFADREKLVSLTRSTLDEVKRLAESYRSGNAFKNGYTVAIAGAPNAGKSTLLNSLLGDERAIVSDIPGTTRDTIEDTAEIGGILFRFIDTAGIRESDDVIEQIGVSRAKEAIGRASLTLLLVDPTQPVDEQLRLVDDRERGAGSLRMVVRTKADIGGDAVSGEELAISASTGKGIEELKNRMVKLATSDFNPMQEMVVTNARHYEALKAAEAPLMRLLDGIEGGITADFLAQDLREADRYLAEITGAVSSTEILHSIFSRYCIGK